MQFYRPRKSSASVPIVPLIDILVILLIFFIVTMQPKKSRPIIDIEIPVANKSITSSIKEKRIVLAVRENGDIFLNGKQVHVEMLVKYLKDLKAENPLVKLELEADKAITLERMIFVTESLNESGFDTNLPTRVINRKQ